jgi:hypothetical protein
MWLKEDCRFNQTGCVMTPGEVAYREDVVRRGFYPDGQPRRTWAQLSDWARSSWEKNPTARDWSEA